MYRPRKNTELDGYESDSNSDLDMGLEEAHPRKKPHMSVSSCSELEHDQGSGHSSGCSSRRDSACSTGSNTKMLPSPVPMETLHEDSDVMDNEGDSDDSDDELAEVFIEAGEEVEEESEDEELVALFGSGNDAEETEGRKQREGAVLDLFADMHIADEGCINFAGCTERDSSTE